MMTEIKMATPTWVLCPMLTWALCLCPGSYDDLDPMPWALCPGVVS